MRTISRSRTPLRADERASAPYPCAGRNPGGWSTQSAYPKPDLIQSNAVRTSPRVLPQLADVVVHVSWFAVAAVDHADDLFVQSTLVAAACEQKQQVKKGVPHRDHVAAHTSRARNWVKFQGTNAENGDRVRFRCARDCCENGVCTEPQPAPAFSESGTSFSSATRTRSTVVSAALRTKSSQSANTTYSRPSVRALAIARSSASPGAPYQLHELRTAIELELHGRTRIPLQGGVRVLRVRVHHLVPGGKRDGCLQYTPICVNPSDCRPGGVLPYLGPQGDAAGDVPPAVELS